MSAEAKKPTLLTISEVDLLVEKLLLANGLDVTQPEVGKFEVDGNVPESLHVLLPRLLEALTGREISIATLQFLTGANISSHYQGPNSFEEVVAWHDYMDTVLKSTSIPVAERWSSAENLGDALASKVQILSFDTPEIKIYLEQVSDWAVEIMSHAEDFDRLDRDTQNRLLLLAKQYAANIDYVMSFARTSFKESLKPTTVGVTLLRGGKRFEDGFRVDESHRVRVEAKRLDFGHEMFFGFKDWSNLEGLERLPSLELAFVDDCGATFGSIESAIISLKQRAEDGEIPEIESVTVYLTVATQQGIIDFDKHMQELGIPYRIITADIAYQLSSLGYIERAVGETRENETIFTVNQPFVGDMGYILDLANRPVISV